LTENQSKIFLNLSNHTIPTTPTIFSIKFKVLEVGRKNFKSKQTPQLPEQNSTTGPESDTIHALFTTLNDTIHAPRHYSLNYTNNMHTTQKHYHNEHIYQLNHT